MNSTKHSRFVTYAKGIFVVGFDVKKLRNEGRGEAIFKETEKTHFPQQLLHVGENFAEIEGSSVPKLIPQDSLLSRLKLSRG
ncbi:hypothetical protein F2Q69_00050406 [Brassica cretica]|uniref:Uncharacterized protein n=1 Tax=Brassica cretica TaxID=69181 RepID=A0A8S9PRK1_BRACR|nr:hypothetical protein F2Q69_00050406 [Brassica cretica]